MKADAGALLRENVKALMGGKRGAQAALARALRVKEPSVSRWLAGGNQMKLERLDDIAAHFGITVAELFKSSPKTATVSGRDLTSHTSGVDSDLTLQEVVDGSAQARPSLSSAELRRGLTDIMSTAAHLAGLAGLAELELAHNGTRDARPHRIDGTQTGPRRGHPAPHSGHARRGAGDD